MNTYELEHEFYELHLDNGIPNQNAPTEEKDTDARIFSHTDPDAISLTKRCNSAIYVKIKIATEAFILMILSAIVSQCAKTISYLIGKK